MIFDHQLRTISATAAIQLKIVGFFIAIISHIELQADLRQAGKRGTFVDVVFYSSQVNVVPSADKSWRGAIRVTSAGIRLEIRCYKGRCSLSL